MKACKLELLTLVYACVVNTTKRNDFISDLNMIAHREGIIRMKALQRQEVTSAKTRGDVCKDKR